MMTLLTDAMVLLLQDGVSPGSALCLSARELGTATRYYGAELPPLKAQSVGLSQRPARRKKRRFLSRLPAHLFSDPERFAIEAGHKRLTYTGPGIVDLPERHDKLIALVHQSTG